MFGKDLLTMQEMSYQEFEKLMELTAKLKRERFTSDYKPLQGRAIGMIFAKSSTRTRVSFEVGIGELGGQALYLDAGKMQELENSINIHSKRLAIKTTNTEFENQLIITKADKQTLDDGNSVLGNVSGVTDTITIRIYNCSDSDMQNIKNNYDVTNIRNF